MSSPDGRTDGLGGGGKMADFLSQHADRIAVEDDVMGGDQHDGAVRSKPHQRHPQKARLRQVERLRRLFQRDLVDAVGVVFGRGGAQIDHAQAEGHLFDHLLRQLPLVFGEPGAEDLMPVDDAPEGGFQAGCAQLAAQLPSHGDVQRGVARRDLVHEPELALDRGDREARDRGQPCGFGQAIHVTTPSVFHAARHREKPSARVAPGRWP
jgi:hypothetical protein